MIYDAINRSTMQSTDLSYSGAYPIVVLQDPWKYPDPKSWKFPNFYLDSIQEISIWMADLGSGMGNFYPDTDLGYPKLLFSLFLLKH